MKPQPASTLDRLHDATLRLVASDSDSASVRAIAKAAGVTEGALYRHYTGRDELVAAVYAKLIEPMIAEKETLLQMRAPMRDRLREWVRATYVKFDDDPEAFTFVFLVPHQVPRSLAHIAGRQSAILAELFVQGQVEGCFRNMDVDLAVTLFIGLLLSVPMRIRGGKLKKPAAQYIDETADAMWRVLAIDET